MGPETPADSKLDIFHNPLERPQPTPRASIQDQTHESSLRKIRKNQFHKTSPRGSSARTGPAEIGNAIK